MEYTMIVSKERILEEISDKINSKKEERKYWQNVFNEKKAFYDVITSNGCTHANTEKTLEDISQHINDINETLDDLNKRYNELSNYSEDEIELKISR